MTTINDIVTPPIPPELDFSFDPEGSLVAFIIGGSTYTDATWRPQVYYIDVDTETTFTVSGTTNQFVNYEWDFGDGSKAYGSEVIHTYTISSTHFRIILKGTLSDGRKFRVSKQVYVE